MLHPNPRWNIPNTMDTIPNIEKPSLITKSIHKSSKISSQRPYVLGAKLSGAQLSALKKWQIGPRTVGPRKCTIPKTKISSTNKTHHPNCKQRCSQISNMFSKIPNTQVKTQNISVKIPNNHPKLHNHHPKYKKYPLNHQIPTPKSENVLQNIKFTVPNNR